MNTDAVGITRTLLDQSVLSETQLESLLSYLKVATGEWKLREAAAHRLRRPVTVGSYYRTVQQARRKVRASVVTVLIAVSMGLVKVEDVRRLFDLVGKDSVELEEDEQERFSAVLQALLNKIVM